MRRATALLGLVTLLACLVAAPGRGQAQDVARGEYLAQAGGCLGCHVEARDGAVPFAGGRALKSPFGVFYGPNITPHPEAGIGRWTEADFRRAMREGIRPDGARYFPAFPYVAFTRIGDADLRDLWAYLRSLPPSPQRNRAHDLSFPYNIRLGVALWNFLHFTPGAMPDGKAQGPEARGQYLAEALGHCGECHTPRDWTGGLRRDATYAGATMNGAKVPPIAPERLARWSAGDLSEFLSSGMTPDGDFAGGEMAEVIRNSTGKLTPEDLAALVAHLRAPSRR
ncbi:MAG: c-type cytochrome [Alphaproteobacteria bacterium]|nr:c-type cytochrome [Alphaproteobacteria bacterium]